MSCPEGSGPFTSAAGLLPGIVVVAEQRKGGRRNEWVITQWETGRVTIVVMSLLCAVLRVLKEISCCCAVTMVTSRASLITGEQQQHHKGSGSSNIYNSLAYPLRYFLSSFC